MIRFLFRMAAALSLAIAVLFAVSDATRTVAASAFTVTPMAQNWNRWWPDSFVASRQWVVDTFGTAGWQLVELILRMPGFAIFALLALFFYAIGFRRTPRRSQFGSRA